MKGRSVRSIAASLGRLSARWLDPDFFYRKKAVAALESNSGFSDKVSAALLESFFSELTAKKLLALLDSELGDHRCLDGFVKTSFGTRVRALGPRLIAHVFASNVPGPAVLSVIHGLLLNSDNVAKPSSRDEGFLGVYLESLAAADPALAAKCRLLGPADRASAANLFSKADLVVAYGSDESIASIRRLVPAKTLFAGYGHRVSFEILFKESLTRAGAAGLARRAARDVWMVNQQGCLSPATFYVEKGGRVTPAEFAGLLSAEIDRLSAASQPFIQTDSRRKLNRLKNQTSARIDANLGLSLADGGLTAYVKPFSDLKKVYSALSKMKPHLQAAAVEGPPARRLQAANALSTLGVNRICRTGRMQDPPLTWHHDGHPNLANWVTWSDLET